MKFSRDSNWILAVTLAAGLGLGGFWGYWIGYDRGARQTGADLRERIQQQTNLWADYESWAKSNTRSNTGAAVSASR